MPRSMRRCSRPARDAGHRPLLDRYPRELSGGQRQRVAIGRAIVRDARLFLFDEPLSNLDAQLRDEMRGEIKRLHQELGKTMIYVTHDQIEAMTTRRSHRADARRRASSSRARRSTCTSARLRGSSRDSSARRR